jgi:uncharacterized protein YqgV (UPF0045/DUF77 family)
MKNNVNLAIQVLPLGIAKEMAYGIIDEAIKVIADSGLKYEVCPFETVVEGAYEDVMNLLDNVQSACNKAGAEEVLINMKLQRSFQKNISIEDKTGKYR